MLRVPDDFGERVRAIYADDHLGVVGFPDFVDPEYLGLLVQEAREAHYRVPQAGILSGVGVSSIEPDSHPHATTFRDAYQKTVRESTGDLFTAAAMGIVTPVALNLNGLSYLRYPEGMGCTKHRDGPNYKNMVALFMLEGENGVWVEGTEYGTGPGSLTVIRASRFPEERAQEDCQPIRWVEPVSQERRVLRMSEFTV